jgi:hypothetical protein
MMRMKSFYIASFLAFVLLFPVSTGAQSVSASSAERSALLSQIAFLIEQISMLQEIVNNRAALQSGTPHVLSVNLRQSRFYDGTYAALYRVEGATIAPIVQNRIRTIDAQMWELTKDVFGQGAVRTYIDEFRVYEDEDADYDAFIEQKPRSDDWIFGVNAADMDMSYPPVIESLARLFIHEYAHVLIHYRPEVGGAFENYWSTNDLEHARILERTDRESRRETLIDNYYDNNVDRFVSAYATTNAEEDFAESFLHFVTERSPTGNDLKHQKVRFFYQYLDFVEIRDDIRERLNKYAWF